MESAEDQMRVMKAAQELENLKQNPLGSDGLPFPPLCRSLLYQIKGNSKCVDCGNRHPSWASLTYGVLLCVNCSGRHRSYGVQCSRVRSIDMDAWSHDQVLTLLEGGNHQMKQFFVRHQMNGESVAALDHQYKTKAARFYKTHFRQHVDEVSKRGRYSGRVASRKRCETQKPPYGKERKSSHSILERRPRSVAVQ